MTDTICEVCRLPIFHSERHGWLHLDLTDRDDTPNHRARPIKKRSMGR